MTDERIGQFVAAVRRYLGLRQVDVAAEARVGQKVVSLIERGLLARVSVDAFRRVCVALEIRPDLTLQWRGGLGDRLIDRTHAAIVERVVRELGQLGWEASPEFSFNVFGERGSVDILAWHPALHALLIVEVKSRLTDLQGMLLALSRKLRLVPPLVAAERDWRRAALGHIVVLADTRFNRRTVASHRSTFDASFPARTTAVRAWLGRPDRDLAGLWFVSVARHLDLSGADREQRVRRGRRSVA